MDFARSIDPAGLVKGGTVRHHQRCFVLLDNILQITGYFFPIEPQRQFGSI